MPQRFDVEVSRTLLGRNHAESQWEKPAFAALLEAVETLALQRGIERWEPGMVTRAKQRNPAAESASAGVTRPKVPVLAGTERPAPLAFASLSEGDPFQTALPLVADLAAGPFSAGFEAVTLDAWAEFDWVRVPRHLARPTRFVVRITGDSMAPTLNQGDFVVFEYHRAIREAGRIVIVADFQGGTEAGECAVKRLKADEQGLWITSDNPAYPKRKLAESAEDYPILGVAVWNLMQGRACR
jgi:phage repressor protein C with HTH and peptisase S24 domain